MADLADNRPLGAPSWDPAVVDLSTTEASTRIDWVARRLRDVILRGVIPAGAKIQLTQLSKEWNVSATPLREAIQRLASEGLIESTPQRGARVAAVSPLQAKELYELRILFEPLALHDSMRHFTEVDRAAVGKAFNNYRSAWAGRRQMTYTMHETHKLFHDTAISKCSSTWLRNLVMSLTQHCMRYTTWLAERDRIAEHALISDAIQRDDVRAATEAIARHSQPGLQWALGELRRSGTPFESLDTSSVLSAMSTASAILGACDAATGPETPPAGDQ